MLATKTIKLLNCVGPTSVEFLAAFAEPASPGCSVVGKEQGKFGSNVHRLNNIQALRAVAVLLVVGRHLQIFAARLMGHQSIAGQFLIGDMGVDLFFVISGFIMVTVHRAPVTCSADTINFLYRRVSRIYPMYWLYSIPAVAIYVSRPGWLHRADAGMPIHAVRSLLLWPQQHWPPLGQAWSLIDEMYFYLVFAGLLLLPGKWFLRGLLGWSLFVLAGNALLNAHPALASPEAKTLFAMLTLEFIAGALVGLIVHRTKPGRRYAAGGWLAVVIGAAWIVASWLTLQVHLTGSSRVLGYGLPAAALVYGSTVLEKTGWVCPRFLNKIGDWSFSIYLSHIFVIGGLAQVISWLPTSKWVAEVLLEVGVVSAVLVVGALSYCYLETPLLRLSRRPIRRPAGQLESEPAANR